MESGNKILIVSNDMYVVRLLKKIIQDYTKQYRVENTGTYQEIEHIEIIGFSIIIIDDNIAGATGLETLNIFRFQKKFKKPLLFLSNSEDINKQASIAGANHTIKKPLNPKTFLSLLEKLVPKTQIKENRKKSTLDISDQPVSQTTEPVYFIEQSQNDRSYTKRKVRKTFIRASIIILLAISFFLVFRFNFQGKKEVSWFIPEKLSEMTSNQEDYFFEDKHTVKQDEELNESVFLDPEKEKPATDSIVEKKEPVQVQEKQKKHYYVIAGSFKEEKNADKLTKELKKQKYASEKMSMPQGTFLVTYSKHNDMNSAQKEKYRIREKVNPHAWILHH